MGSSSNELGIIVLPALITSLDRYHALSFFAVSLVALVICAISRKFATSIKDVPGPFVASFSSLWRVYYLWEGHSEEEILRLHKKHGHFVRIAENEVSVSHPDAVKQVLQANIAKGKFYSMFSLPDYHYVNQMSELDPTRHIQKTRSLSAGFSLTNITKTEPYIDSVLKLFKTRFDELSDTGSTVQFQDWFSFFAFDVLGEVTFSKSFGFVESGTDIRNAIANTGSLVYYIASARPATQLSHLRHMPSCCRKSQENPEIRHDMMQRWLDVRASHPDRLSERDIFAAAVANIGAGAETISATAQAFIYYLLRNPQFLKRARDEIDAAQARGELSSIIQNSEAAKLPFFQACLKESYRIHPGVAHNLPRVVPKGGMTIAGRYFPEGVILSVNPWVIHRNTGIFGEDSEIYNPDRWLQGDAKKMDSFLIHWGTGYSQCPGRNLAQFELNKVLSTILRDYDVEMVDPTKEWKFGTRFLAVPYGWPCKIRRRQKA
ncbi:hypothetical protein N7454_006993 [Penicillium verhagenii]|nr:hypothetical protein N7454_006993 [Penicillium verhagenii]